MNESILYSIAVEMSIGKGQLSILETCLSCRLHDLYLQIDLVNLSPLRDECTHLHLVAQDIVLIIIFLIIMDHEIGCLVTKLFDQEVITK